MFGESGPYSTILKDKFHKLDVISNKPLLFLDAWAKIIFISFPHHFASIVKRICGLRLNRFSYINPLHILFLNELLDHEINMFRPFQLQFFQTLKSSFAIYRIINSYFLSYFLPLHSLLSQFDQQVVFILIPSFFLRFHVFSSQQPFKKFPKQMFLPNFLFVFLICRDLRRIYNSIPFSRWNLWLSSDRQRVIIALRNHPIRSHPKHFQTFKQLLILTSNIWNQIQFLFAAGGTNYFRLTLTKIKFPNNLLSLQLLIFSCTSNKMSEISQIEQKERKNRQVYLFLMGKIYLQFYLRKFIYM